MFLRKIGPPQIQPLPKQAESNPIFAASLKQLKVLGTGHLGFSRLLVTRTFAFRLQIPQQPLKRLLVAGGLLPVGEVANVPSMSY
jgi:hypothetical protein